MYSAHVTEVAEKEDLFNGLEFCDGKAEKREWCDELNDKK